jgi:ABC-type sugar transport system substrate-binding protein
MNKIVVVGANGTPDALSSIKAGKLDLTVNFCGFNQGVRAIDALKSYVEKGAKPSGAAPQEVITSSNLAEMQAKLAKGCAGPA